MIRYNLQFFAQDGPGGEKTEPASDKKLNDARKKGQVAKSKDLTASIALLVLFIVMQIYSPYLGERFMNGFRKVYIKIGDLSGADGQIDNLAGYYHNFITQSIWDILLSVLPFFAVAFVIAFVVDIIQVKWKVSTEPMKPKLDKVSPISGFKRIFSTRTLMSLGKSLVIIVISGIIVYNKLQNYLPTLLNTYKVTLQSGITLLGNLIFELCITIAVVYLILGALDFLFEFFKFRNDMKMTKQEVKDEYKSTEGDPEIKGKQKRRMMEASRRRMMQAVPEADVVITNPTHFAVALSYEQNSGKAPVVVAKGEDFLALKIKEVAKEHHVEVVEDKPLARMLYYNVELGEEIPPELYQAVAEILAYVWKLNHKI